MTKKKKKIFYLCFKELTGVTSVFNLDFNSPGVGEFLCPGRRPRRVMHHLQPRVPNEGQAGGGWEQKGRFRILSSAGAPVVCRGRTQLMNSFWQGQQGLVLSCCLLARQRNCPFPVASPSCRLHVPSEHLPSRICGTLRGFGVP